ncbi:MAG: DUF4381 domain-containing protein [Ostreibacterium sp.]
MMSTLSPEQLKQLERLKDIHLPEPIEWWPLAPGWWLLMILIILFIVAILWWFFSSRKTVKKAALDELKTFSMDDSITLSVNLSALMRRVAIQHYGEQIAAVSGQSWANFLAKDKIMSQQIAQFFADAPYAKLDNPPSSKRLITATRRWIRSNT